MRGSHIMCVRSFVPGLPQDAGRHDTHDNVDAQRVVVLVLVGLGPAHESVPVLLLGHRNVAPWGKWAEHNY